MKKQITALAFVFLCILTLVGCDKVSYNAKIITNGISYHQEWLDNNQVVDTQGSEDLPKTRTYIVTNENELNEIFTEFPQVSFENEMIIVYCYISVYVRKQKLTKVELNNNILEIEFKVDSKLFFQADSTAPYTRICVIKLNKIDFENVNITYLK